MLRTLQRFPVDEAAPREHEAAPREQEAAPTLNDLGAGVVMVPGTTGMHLMRVPPTSMKVPAVSVPSIGDLRLRRLGRVALAAAAVAAAVVVLRLATVPLDALAHAAAGLLQSPSTSVAAFAVAGAAAGGLHALSGPDHLAALAPLALRMEGGPGTAFRKGVLWGSAHVLGQLVLGAGLLTIGKSTLVSNLFATMGAGAVAERLSAGAVGLVLVAIGMMGLKEAREWREDDEEESSGNGAFDWRTFGTGVLSGMHPDALLLCLPALALPTRLAGFTYLAAFGVGTLGAMGAYAAALRRACLALGPRAVRNVSVVASGVAIAVGALVCGSALGLPVLGGLL